MAKVVGITGGTITLNSIDYLITSGSLKVEMEKLEYKPLAGDGWVEQVTGGCRKCSGSIKGAVDTTKLSAGADGLPIPMSSTAAIPFNYNCFGGITATGNCVVYDMDFNVTEKLVEFTANWESTGAVTFA